jgi:serine/threonine protein kinase
MSPNILDYGEWLGDIEIVKPLIILRSSVLYEARQQKNKVLLKVAHPGDENTERLKREAEFLSTLPSEKARQNHLPVLLPPYQGTTTRKIPYGRTMLQDHLLYFCLFEHFNGEPLRYLLTQNPQLWINHVGWILISSATSVAFLQSTGKLHGAISPDSILVRFDENPNVPRILLFDLGVASDVKQFQHDWYPFLVPPAYTAPELLDTAHLQPGFATDVYGLGLTLYELLVGQPTFPFKLRSDEEVYHAVEHNQRVRMNREDVKPIADMTMRAVSDKHTARPENAKELAGQLIQYFGPLPEKKRSRLPNQRTTMIIIAALLAVAFLITVAATVGEAFQGDNERNQALQSIFFYLC